MRHRLIPSSAQNYTRLPASIRRNTMENTLLGLHIEGRRWFQKTWGNTYHSVRIFANGKEIGYIAHEYGNGDQFLQTALDWLREKELIPAQEYYSNGHPKNYGTLYLRETLGGTYSVIDVERKKDL
jgi:hypothetical protein